MIYKKKQKIQLNKIKSFCFAKHKDTDKEMKNKP